MDRIGIASSKIAKGNLVLYNMSVVLLTFMFSLFVFVIAGAAVLLALILVGYIVNGMAPHNLLEDRQQSVSVCVSVLMAVVAFFAVMALIRNIKFKSIN